MVSSLFFSTLSFLPLTLTLTSWFSTWLTLRRLTRHHVMFSSPFLSNLSFLPLTLTLTFLVFHPIDSSSPCVTPWALWSLLWLLLPLFLSSSSLGSYISPPPHFVLFLPLSPSILTSYPPLSPLSSLLHGCVYPSSLPCPFTFHSSQADIFPARTGYLSSPTSHPLITSDYLYYNWFIQFHWCAIYISLICYCIVFLYSLVFHWLVSTFLTLID
jgi:hypothetical protein